MANEPLTVNVPPSRAGAATPPGRAPTTGTLVGLGAAIAAVVVLIWLLFGTDLDSKTKGGVATLLMMVLMVLRVPVAVAMGAAGALGIWALTSTRALTGTLGDLPFGTAASFTLTVLPMFIFMGIMLWRSGITGELYVAARHWLGWMPAGLAVTTNTAGAGLASVSGSTLGITYALSRIGIPEMLRAGYDRRLAVGAVMVAGTVGQLIPPSIYAVVYAGFAETAVGPQLIAGLIPGILLALAYALLMIIAALARPSIAPKSTAARATWGERWSSLARVWPLPVITGIVIGGLYGGIFTATEAGAFGALGALTLAAVRLSAREFFAGLWTALRETAAAIGLILFLIVGAAILSRMLALSGAASWVVQLIEDANFGRGELILVMVVAYLLLGTFMEELSMMLLTIPVLLPVVVAVGIDPIWFGVFVILLTQIAIISPPLGILVFVVYKLVQNKEVAGDVKITLWDTYKGGMLFMPAPLLVVLLIALFPELVMWLPDLAKTE